MAFENVRDIIRIGSAENVLKMLLISASVSRPKLRSLCFGLLRPFVHDGEVAVEYACHDQTLKCFIRMSDISDDQYSLLELGLRDSYLLDPAFEPDLVIDGGGNIGLFTLWVTGLAKSAKRFPRRIAIVEPMPRNVAQIRKHLATNGIEGEVLEGCLGGESRSVPFYVRGAIDSSFDPEKAYERVVQMPVYTVEDAMGSEPAERILMKLDIEGMELEVLSRFVPEERRAVYLVGELHHATVNGPTLESLFEKNGWTFGYIERTAQHSTFRACSPAALPLLPSMMSLNPAALRH